MKILTNQNKIPWGAVAWVLFPWFAISVRETISTTGMTFTVRRFFDDPAIIGAILSANAFFGFTIGSMASFCSDYIWTRWGRRLPFLYISFFAGAILSIFIPLSNTWLTLLILILAYQCVVDFGSCYHPFTMEIIPPRQRGRSGAISHWYKTIGATIALWWLVGNFDHVYYDGAWMINGERLMYWMNAAILFLAGLVFLFMIRESRPETISRVPITSLLTRHFLREIFQPKILRLIGLALVMQSLWMGTAQFEALIVTEQWGYSKAEYGRYMGLSTVVSLILVPCAGWMSDRIDRIKVLYIGVVVVTLIKLLFYFSVIFLADGYPPVAAVIAFGLLKSTVGSFMAVACVPLLFDYVHNDRVGTLGCAMGIAFGLSVFIGTNIMGWWIKIWSFHIIGLPEGVYDYFASYHWVLLLGIAGIAYCAYFNHAARRINLCPRL